MMSVTSVCYWSLPQTWKNVSATRQVLSPNAFPAKSGGHPPMHTPVLEYNGQNIVFVCIECRLSALRKLVMIVPSAQRCEGGTISLVLGTLSLLAFAGLTACIWYKQTQYFFTIFAPSINGCSWKTASYPH